MVLTHTNQNIVLNEEKFRKSLLKLTVLVGKDALIH